MTKIASCILLLLGSLAFRPPAFSQSAQDKFSAGLRLGPTLWLNDMNDRRVGIGFEGIGRYGVTKTLLVGVAAGYDLLKAHQFPLKNPNDPEYLKANVYHGSVDAWVQLSSSNSFSPYLYAGLGGMIYTRKDANGFPYPVDDGSHGSLYVPLGIGFEAAVGKNSSIMFDFGFRLIDANTDYIPTGSDSYPTVKVGYTMYFGENDDDDDDNDGLTNGEERRLGTDPQDPDTDHDGLRDGEEVRKFHTDPLKADTDGDRITDGDEVLKFGTDPLKADTDGDGLNDGDEIYTYNTNPLKADSDGDGLTDGEEILKYHTDPLKQDTDDDGLTDSNELFAYKTDPRKADTDGGGVDDGTEVRRGSNPLDPSDDFPKKQSAPEPPLGVGESYVPEGVKFGPWSSRITPAAEAGLEKMYEMMTLFPSMEFEIRGYTDNSGDRGRNIAVSKERAESVMRWLVRRGIAARRLTAKGFGPEKPVAPNTTEEGREKNRRIEFVRTK